MCRLTLQQSDKTPATQPATQPATIQPRKQQNKTKKKNRPTNRINFLIDKIKKKLHLLHHPLITYHTETRNTSLSTAEVLYY